MPIYEYRCEACGHTLDALQKLSDEPLRDCPECKRQALKRLVSAPAFRLKGSGWYETDFKSDKEKRRNLAESPKDAKAKTSDGGGTSKDGKAEKSDKAGKDAKPAADGKAKTKTTDKTAPKGTGSEAA